MGAKEVAWLVDYFFVECTHAITLEEIRISLHSSENFSERNEMISSLDSV